MKTLVLKELRENVKLAALGLLIYTMMLLGQYRGYIASPTNMSQPLADANLLWSTIWFGSIFGAVLGWLQIHNERRPDLWAFLIHRPMTCSGIFLAKTLAGLGFYALVMGLPLLGFIVWARWPGHVAAPFELRMLRPLPISVLTGVAFYYAGMLTGLRQARWYASRALGLGMALIVCLLSQYRPDWWQGLLVVLLGTPILIAATWGGFQTHGYYRGQPLWGKAALTVSLMLGSLVVAAFAAAFAGKLFVSEEQNELSSNYAVTKDGVVFKVTQGAGRSPEIVDLDGKPLTDAKTGRMIELGEFTRRQARAIGIRVGRDNLAFSTQWSHADMRRAIPWHASSDTLWYYWGRYGRLAGYDVATRRFIGSLGPNGFAPDLSGGGDRFSNPANGEYPRTLSTATTLYQVDPEQRATKILFTTTSDDPILATSELMPNEYDWEYTAVVTKKSIHLLTAEGKPVWKVPYEPKEAASGRAEIYFLEPPGQFVLWLTPSYWENNRANWKLPIHVTWLARDQGVVRSAEVPSLTPAPSKPRPEEKLVSAVMPPSILLTLPRLEVAFWLTGIPRELLLLSWGSAVLVCLPIGWWLGRRYHFSFAAQMGWAVFHLLFGVPGLLAFLSVQEWPAREACPNCKKLRAVDRAQCEHCGAGFAPPEKTGTEVFAPLGVKVEAQAVG